MTGSSALWRLLGDAEAVNGEESELVHDSKENEAGWGPDKLKEQFRVIHLGPPSN